MTVKPGDVEFLLDTIIWMSGSPSFAPTGEAGEEWAKRRKHVYRIMERAHEGERVAERQSDTQGPGGYIEGDSQPGQNA